jgi:hypothetical protein
MLSESERAAKPIPVTIIARSKNAIMALLLFVIPKVLLS